MVKSNKMSPEVLIYIQNLKMYFANNEDAQKYFAVDNNESVFFEYVAEMSQKNFDEHEEPALTLEQFEELRRKISDFAGKKEEATGVFLFLGNFGYVSLN